MRQEVCYLAPAPVAIGPVIRRVIRRVIRPVFRRVIRLGYYLKEFPGQRNFEAIPAGV